MRSTPGNGSRKTALPGANKVWKPLADGGVARIWYAWRGAGAPQIGRFEGATRAEVIAKENSVEGAKTLAEGYASAAHPSVDTSTLGGVLTAYEASSAFKDRADSTKKKERGPIGQVRDEKLGSMPVRALAAGGAKTEIRAWLEAVAQKQGPRAADVRRDIISKALNWAKGEGLGVKSNPAEGIKDFHYVDRSDIIWLAADVMKFEAAARATRRKLLKQGAPEPNKPPVVVLALLLAIYTGLRREDLCGLAWRDVGPNAITVRPLKSLRRAKTAKKKAPAVVVIPRTPELDAVLAQLHPAEDDQVKRPWVLTNSYGKKWTPSGLTSTFIKARDAARVVYVAADGADPVAKTLHDCRGSFVTHMRCLGFSKEEVAEMVGWETEDVDRVAKRYADADRIALAWIERMKRKTG